MEITIKLDLQEVNGLLDLMGKLPTETNIWPLAAKIRAQAKMQIPQQEQDNVGQGSSTD